MIVAREKTFTVAPAGRQKATLADIEDLLEVKTTWDGEEKLRHMIRFIWNLDLKKDGQPYVVKRDYNLTLTKGAKLREDVEELLCRPLTAAEKTDFVVDTLIGKHAVLTIIHREGSKGGTFANIESLRGLDEDIPF